MWLQSLIVVVAISVVAVWKVMVLCPISLDPNTNLLNKVVLVTGGSAGIGLETVRKMYEWNATVIVPVRSIEKGKRVASEIIASQEFHDSSSVIDLMELDLNSFDSVTKFAESVRNKYHHIDIVILNAGMHGNSDVQTTVDGVEVVYQVNHLSHALLARLLVPITSRYVFVSSMMHYWGALDKNAYSVTSRNADPSSARLGMSTYCDTKLMNVAFSNALDRRLQDYNQLHPEFHRTSVSIHPGYVISDIDRGSPHETLMAAIRQVTARHTADGAVTQIAAATNPSIVSMGGGLYFEDQCIMSGCKECLFCKVNKRDGQPNGGVVPHATSTDLLEQDWLWNTTATIIGLPTEL